VRKTKVPTYRAIAEAAIQWIEADIAAWRPAEWNDAGVDWQALSNTAHMRYLALRELARQRLLSRGGAK
jgi:hypothetical protein